MRGILYFFTEIRFPDHWRASSHFFVEISRLIWARDLGSGTGLAPPCSRSTPRASGSSAASFAHSSAFSLPGTPLWAGNHRISKVILGLALRSAAMCRTSPRARRNESLHVTPALAILLGHGVTLDHVPERILVRLRPELTQELDLVVIVLVHRFLALAEELGRVIIRTRLVTLLARLLQELTNHRVHHWWKLGLGNDI